MQAGGAWLVGEGHQPHVPAEEKRMPDMLFGCCLQCSLKCFRSLVVLLCCRHEQALRHEVVGVRGVLVRLEVRLQGGSLTYASAACSCILSYRIERRVYRRHRESHRGILVQNTRPLCSSTNALAVVRRWSVLACAHRSHLRRLMCPPRSLNPPEKVGTAR